MDRQCPHCQRLLPGEAFPVDRSKASGRKAQCRDCDNSRCRDYYRRTGTAQITPCSGCGEQRPTQVGVCADCRLRSRLVPCEHCGADFERKSPRQRFCSLPCSAARWRTKLAPAPTPDPTGDTTCAG